MIQTDDFDLVFAPFRTPGIDSVAMREVNAELPCNCAKTRGLCSSCHDRIVLLGEFRG